MGRSTSLATKPLHTLSLSPSSRASSLTAILLRALLPCRNQRLDLSPGHTRCPAIQRSRLSMDLSASTLADLKGSRHSQLGMLFLCLPTPRSASGVILYTPRSCMLVLEITQLTLRSDRMPRFGTLQHGPSELFLFFEQERARIGCCIFISDGTRLLIRFGLGVS